MSLFKLFLPFFFLLAPILVSAQKKIPENLPKFDAKHFHFGFSLGLNTSDFTINRKKFDFSTDSILSINSAKQSGFDLAIISDLHLHPYLSLRFIPGLSFAQRNLEYTFNSGDTATFVEIKPIESTFIQLPLYLKYRSARVNNFAAYIVGGGKYAIDLASQENVELGEYVVKLKKHDMHAEIGFGLDLFLEYFKFSPEIKMAFGLKDVLVKDGSIYTNPINSLNSRIFLISFHFEG